MRTPEGQPIPPNTLAELMRDLERKRLVDEQIVKIEKARLEQLKRAPKVGPNLMVLLLMRVIGIGIDTADKLITGAVDEMARDAKVGRAEAMLLNAGAYRQGRTAGSAPSLLGTIRGRRGRRGDAIVSSRSPSMGHLRLARSGKPASSLPASLQP